MKHLIVWMPALLALATGSAMAEEKAGAKPAQAQKQAAPAAAQGGESQMEILRQKLKTDKRYIVSENMELTAAEAKEFWPVYDAYQKDLDKLNQRLSSIAWTGDR